MWVLEAGVELVVAHAVQAELDPLHDEGGGDTAKVVSMVVRDGEVMGVVAMRREADTSER